MSEPKEGSATHAENDARLKAAMLGKGPGQPEGFLEFAPLPHAVANANVPVAREPEPPAPGEPPVDPTPPAPKGSDPTPPSGDGEGAPPDPVADPKAEAASKILRKYGGVDTKVAKALLDLRRLQTATAEEKKVLEKQLEHVLEFFDEAPGGELVLKVDKAASRLAAARVPTQESEPGIPTEAEALTQVEREWREHYGKTLEDDSLERLIEASKPKIAAEAKRRIGDAVRARKEANAKELLEVGQIADKFWSEHGERFSKVEGQIDDWLAGFTPATRVRLIKENPGILRRIGEAEYLRHNLESVVNEAFEAGMQAAKGEKPSDGATPRGGSAPRGRQTPQGAESDFKAAVVGAGRLAPIESLFKG